VPIRARAVVFGEVLFDVFPDGTRVLGGAPFNVAWHMRGLGADPALITAVGDDEPGREVLDRMEGWDLDRTGVQIADRYRTGDAVVSTRDGAPSFEIAPGQAWDAIADGPARRAMPETARLIYHGTLALRTDRTWQTLKGLTRKAVPTFVDLNLRDPWVTDDRVHWCLSTARWVKLNDDELARITSAPAGTDDECIAAARRLGAEYTIHQVIVTRGARGAIAVSDAGDVARVEAPPVDRLVDTVGAGDAFSSIVCVGILRDWDVGLTLERAAAFAADVCGIQGGTTTDSSLYERHRRAWAAAAEGGVQSGRQDGLYVMSLSIHGLVRSAQIELGRDADTGGQVSYVVDQARAVSAHSSIARVDLVTRTIEDKRVDASYARAIEPMADTAQIVRLPFGPKRYLRKESLWPHLDELVDELTRYIHRSGAVPDVIHGHYADAGYVGARLASLLGVPFVFTGHSLGRVKRDRLLAAGKDADTIEERYLFRTRIEAEERALETASVVIASTHQEIEDQYQKYDQYTPDMMRVIPPGVDLERFSPADAAWPDPPVARELARFLAAPDKPIILALARADERKNFEGLLEAYAGSAALRARANLVLVTGARDDISEMPAGARAVLTRILLLVDRHDLYGLVAYPKAPSSEDVPDLFRLTARRRGVFVNPAFTEPFGLTLIEAAASGVPVVATDDGGPRDIIAACNNGLLVAATRPEAIAAGLERALSSDDEWDRWSANGVAAAHEHFSWSSHANRYVAELQRVIAVSEGARAAPRPSRLPVVDRLLMVDLDGTLTGDDEGLRALLERLAHAGDPVGFGIATGRTLHQARAEIEARGIPVPDVLITGTGTQLHYGERLTIDHSWERHVHHQWDRDAVAEAMAGLTSLALAKPAQQTPLRLRYTRAGGDQLSFGQIRRHLRKRGLRADVIVDERSGVDVLPSRASVGQAVRFLCFKWGLPADRLLTAGDSGNDADMIAGQTLGVVVGNHAPELERLRGQRRVYFARGHHAWGVLEGIDKYDFFGAIHPDLEDDA
jgi:sucrose-phosphate synthase